MCGGRGCFETGVIYEEDETAETGHWLMSCSGLGLSHSHNFQNIEGERNINYEGCQKYPWMVACLLFVTQIMLLILCQFYLNILSHSPREQHVWGMMMMMMVTGDCYDNS